ncbi:hypothetical protein [Actinomadura miaoliensis]|uniref:DUF1440 domain-containing protein n=1 Tax=Actinomadura miaoliensis TaxID=430685 RepID=A0ABP7X2N4_9ACTN
MRREETRPTLARSAARGLVAAMAMTGIRTVTAAVGSYEKSPPEAIFEKHAPGRIRRLPRRQREAVTELAHWAYGTGGGVMFGLLPRRVRLHRAAGPVYGLSIWLAFELGIAPLLGVRHTRSRPALWRAVVAVDHILYGIVVAGWLAPEPSLPPEPSNEKESAEDSSGQEMTSGTEARRN